MSSSNENVEDDGVDGNPGGELNKSNTSQQLRNGSQITNGAAKFKGTKSMSSNQLQVNLDTMSLLFLVHGILALEVIG